MDVWTILPIVISTIAAAFAYYSLKENRRLLKWTTSYSRLRESESMIKDNPKLLELHGVDETLLKKCDTDAEEIAYLLLSLRTMQESYRLEESKGLSPYFRKMFEKPKVVCIWKEILWNRFMFRTKFVDDVNNYIHKANRQEIANSQ